MNKRNLVRKRQKKHNRKRVERNANRKRLRIANKYDSLMELHKRKKKLGLV